MRRVFLFSYDWSNTSGNHTGMGPYISGRLSNDIDNIQVVNMHEYGCYILKFVNLFKVFYYVCWLSIVLKKNDVVFLMEYLGRSSFHVELAMLLKLLRPKAKIYGMVHLSGKHLLEVNKTKKNISRMINYIDRCYVLGSSLASFLEKEIGYKNVRTIFHYVDNEYYKPLDKIEVKSTLDVLCIGNTKRNFDLLRRIIQDMPNVHFNICQGKNDYTSYFGSFANVTLLGYLKEDELLSLMQNSDVNLSVMEDTIGSNVITTALATGMILVVSDVGSIRDYCTDKESYLCRNEQDFIDSINYLVNHLDEIPEKRKKSYERSKLFTYDRFRDVIRQELFGDMV